MIIADAARIFTVPNKNKLIKVEILNLLINTILYNPALAFRIMESQTEVLDLARSVLDEWFAALKSEGGKQLPRVHDKRLSIIALSALLEMDPADIPDSLRDGWPSIVGGVLEVFKTLPEAMASVLIFPNRP
jgi:hypothetical protein